MRLFMLSVSALLLPFAVAAQRYYPTGVQSREMISISTGTTAFWGDVEGSASVTGKSPHIGLSYEYRVMPHVGLRMSGLWYQLKANDAASANPYLRDRNLSFTSSNWELSLMAAAYIRSYPTNEIEFRKKLNAYGVAGIGVTAYTPKAEYEGDKWDLRSLETEGTRYNRTTLVIPFGGGILYSIAPQLDLALQYTYHYTFSDYLDDVSTRYRSQASFSNTTAAILADRRPEVGLDQEPAGAIRGNPGVKDSYSMLSLRVQYHLKRYHYRGRVIRKLYQ